MVGPKEAAGIGGRNIEKKTTSVGFILDVKRRREVSAGRKKRSGRRKGGLNQSHELRQIE